ncbi:MAG: CHAT domain-containing protein [Gemmatimonadales bacterium]|nr:CHAT domain-containing protein [Gemmatimonadales bacterium]NIN48512.1 CHAT domain-containing protein [Gemmatimonadales bacterium]NIP05976.1 CHAT domain-containing protein [Gemmatimonadales bacterium]NIQ99928.1 CHAT domain-containing protein [Gemmatimonadales bacterium]
MVACAAPNDQAREQPTDGTPRSHAAGADAPAAAPSAIELARQHYRQGELDEARAVLLPALMQARAEHDSVVEAQALTLLGLAAYRQGEYEEAHRHQQAALSIKHALNLEKELWSSYNALGLVAWNQGQLPDAMRHFEEAARTARAVEDRVGRAIAANNIGLVHTDLGNYRAARAGFKEMRAISRSLGESRREGIALNNLGMLDVWIGNPERAVASLLEARRLFQAAGYVIGELNNLGQLGTAYAALGEPSKAIAVLDSALQQAREQGLRQEEASNLEALAEIYRDAGDLRRSLRLYADAQEINEELGLQLERGADLRSVAEIHVALGNIQLARQRAQQALTIHRAAGARWEELADLTLLAEVAQESGDSGRSRELVGEARHLARALDARVARVAVALAEARIAERAHAPERVLRVLDAARQDLARGGYGTEWEAEALRARAYADLGLGDSAVAAGRRAVAAVERIRGGFGSGLLRTTYLTERTRVYVDLVLALLRQGKADEAFEVADAMRGRALLEHLTAAHGEIVAAHSTAASLMQGEETLRRVGVLVDQLDQLEATPPPDRDSVLVENIARLHRELAEARSEYEALLVHAAERDPRGTTLLGARRVRATDVQRALLPGEVLLEYLVTPDRVLIFVVRSDAVEVVESALTEQNLAIRVRILRDLLRTPHPDSSALGHVGQGLHQVLLQPVLDAGGLSDARHVIIVPHSVLSYLPYAVLRDGATDRHFVEDYVLSYLPSSAALPLLREDRRSSLRPLAGRSLRSLQVFAPLPEALPSTREEATRVQRSFPGALKHLAEQATEVRVRKALAEPGLVHVATHGVMNARNPMFSRIELAAGSSGRSDDGRLEVHEILGRTVRSPLVFLSGCETGVGVAWSTEFARGEDYTTLAQALLYAGTRNVVATLWRIDDAGAAELAERFYAALGEDSPAEALAQAQRDMLVHGRYSSPYYWAAYQLSGDGRRLEWAN